MNKQTVLKLITAVVLAAAMSACATRGENTAVGAAAGGVAGSALTGGSAIGTIGGAAIGGLAGHEYRR